MTDDQVAVGIAQLKRLDSQNANRIELAHHLTERLKETPGISLPYKDPVGKHVDHIYMIQLKKAILWKNVSLCGNYLPRKV